MNLPNPNVALPPLALYIGGFIGVQRFLLPSVYSYACVVAVAVAIYYYARGAFPSYNAAIIAALFLAVDNGAEAYAETPSLIRYATYMIAAAGTVVGFKAHRFFTVGYLAYATVLALITVWHLDEGNLGAFFASTQVGFIAFVVFCRKYDGDGRTAINLPLLNSFLICCLVSEIGNLMLFYEPSSGDYLSYDSAKSLIALPLLYYISRRGTLVPALITSSLCIYVILNYQTRMIMLALAAVLLLYAVRKPVFAVASAVLVLLLTSATYFDVLESYRAVGTITKALDVSTHDWTVHDFLNTLDPSRYVESTLFFQRHTLNLLFGSGLGSGMHDALNDFRFLSIHDTAFSIEELQSGHFYNFHDVWVDIGLRFGLIFIAAAVLPIFRGVLADDAEFNVLSMALIVLMLCAFYSAAGLLIIGILAIGFRARQVALENAQARQPSTVGPTPQLRA
jgi:hypothetical protein